MSKHFDVIVIGCGPAGLSAATEAARAGVRTLALDRMGPGGEVMNLGPIRHYPEAGGGESGPDLVARLAEEAMAAGAELGFGEVLSLAPCDDDCWTVATDDGSYAARAVVIATGLAKGTTGLDHESGFVGQGISHCAHCDGPLYQGKSVVVAGSGEWALQEAVDLLDMVGTVALVVPQAHIGPVREALSEHVAIEVHAGEIATLSGEDGLEAVHVSAGQETRVLPARALFLYDGRKPATGPFEGLVADSSDGAIMIDEAGATSAAGLFAAGTVRAGARERITEAIADGRRAGQNAARLVTS